MITCIREVRRAAGLTLQDVADRCDPPTTAQTIGRLETGTRTVSVAWLNRIAAALRVAAADLVTLPSGGDLPVVAMLGSQGPIAPRRLGAIVAPRPAAGQVAIRVTVGVGDYRAGDQIWCDRLAPDAFATALHRDALVPSPAGRFAFGRVVAIEERHIRLVPLVHGQRVRSIETAAWIAVATRLVRSL